MAKPVLETFLVHYEWDDETNQWLAAIPALPGCATVGPTLPAARNYLREALELYLDSLEESGQSLPPSRIGRISILRPRPISSGLRRNAASQDRSKRGRKIAS